MSRRHWRSWREWRDVYRQSTHPWSWIPHPRSHRTPPASPHGHQLGQLCHTGFAKLAVLVETARPSRSGETSLARSSARSSSRQLPDTWPVACLAGEQPSSAHQSLFRKLFPLRSQEEHLRSVSRLEIACSPGRAKCSFLVAPRKLHWQQCWLEAGSAVPKVSQLLAKQFSLEQAPAYFRAIINYGCCSVRCFVIYIGLHYSYKSHYRW